MFFVSDDSLYDHNPPGGWFYVAPAPSNLTVPATFSFELNPTFVPQTTTRSASIQVLMDWELLPVNYGPTPTPTPAP